MQQVTSSYHYQEVHKEYFKVVLQSYLIRGSCMDDVRVGTGRAQTFVK